MMRKEIGRVEEQTTYLKIAIHNINFLKPKLMRKQLMILILVLGCLCPFQTVAQITSITKSEALSIAKQQFKNKDVDYYLITSLSSKSWAIFVDADPMKGWEHECYLLTIPKAINGGSSLSGSVVPEKKLLKMPPSGSYESLEVKQRFSSNDLVKPQVSKANLSSEELAVAKRTYAVILSGGYDYMSNYERYWNDCSFIYQTLVNKYGVPKDNIVPIMADGDDPAEDTHSYTGGFKSQDLDLDGDGKKDIYLAATNSNIASTLSQLAKKMNKDDQLFFYVIDHGGTTDNSMKSYIYLWGEEVLHDTALAEMLNQFTSKYINVNVVLGQCFSGGFIDDLSKVGCVVATASKGNEYSWACPDIPYDEFVYQWTCAVNGANHKKVTIDSDADENGYITMEEAFDYAKSHDRMSNEHPQYISTPISVGEDLAFNKIAPSVDLYVKDNPEDTGKEPNLTTDKFWLSPSIWVRNNDDGIYEHEEPIYSPSHKAVTVYVRVHNRGKEKFTQGKMYVHGYWALASTGFRPQAWMGDELYDGGEITGNPMCASVIPDIEAGDFEDVKLTWALPSNLIENHESEKLHFCLLAHITDTPHETWYDGVLAYNCQKYNNDAQKNVSVIKQTEVSDGASVFIRNISDTGKKYSLELIPRTLADEAIYTVANIEMELSQPIYSAWVRGGVHSNNIIKIPSEGNQKVQFVSKDSRLEQISLAGLEFDKVKLRFNFKQASSIATKYTLDLIQKDENGRIIGGETFIVERPTSSLKPLTINESFDENNTILLNTNADSNSRTRWDNSEGITISYDETLKVVATSGENTYQAYVIDEDGEMSTATISLDNLSGGISKIKKEKNEIRIEFFNPASENDYVIVSSVVTGLEMIEEHLSEGQKDFSLDISSLNEGIYIVSYIKDNMKISSQKFTK